MSLTQVRFSGINTNLTVFSDPVTVTNFGNTANRDIGSLFDRSQGGGSNVAIVWQESTSSFKLGYTSSDGTSNANLAFTGNANLRVGNVFAESLNWSNGAPFSSSEPGPGTTGQLQYNNSGNFGSTIGITYTGAGTISLDSIDFTGTLDGDTVIASTIGNVGATVTGSNVFAIQSFQGPVGVYGTNTGAFTGVTATTLVTSANTTIGAGLTVVGTSSFNGVLNVNAGIQNTAIGNLQQSSGKFTTIQGVDTTDSSSTTTGALKIAGGAGIDKNLYVGGTVVSGNVLPSANITYSLGSPTQQWKDVYVGPGSLYVNNQKVLEESAGTIVFSADPGQNINITTSSGGDIEFNPGGSIQLKGNVELSAGKSIVTAGGASTEFPQGIKVDNIATRSSGSVTIDNLNISGNLTVSGTTTTINTADLNVADNLITLNSDFASGNPTENAGIRILRGDENAVQLRWNETSNKWEFTNDGSTYVEFGTNYSDSNVTSLLNSFGSNPITTTGTVSATNFVGSGQYLTAITGANVSGTVSAATTATTATTATYVTGLTSSNVTTALGYTPISVSDAHTAISGNLTTAQNYTNTANTNMKSYVDNEISTTQGQVTAANSSMKSYVDGQISTTQIQITSANVGVVNYVNTVVNGNLTTAQSYADSAVSTANSAMKSYVDNEISTTQSQITTANSGVVTYVDGQISTVNSSITTANSNMKTYVDGEIITTQGQINTAIGANLTTAQSYADSAVSTANSAMKSYVDNEISTTQSQITTANSGVVAYVDSQISTTQSQITTANSGVVAYIDNEITTTQGQITTANSNMKTYVDGEITTTQGQITTANSGVVTYIDNQVTTANTGMQSYVDTTVAAANTAMGQYVVGEISTVNSTITTANTNMKTYVDGEISTTQGQITTANAGVVTYIDGQISTVNNSITTANSGVVSYVNTANTNMKSYVDGQISTTVSDTNTAIGANLTTAQNYTDTAISNLVASAPATLDTLNEIAAALGNDPNLATTLTNTIATANTNMKSYVDNEISTTQSENTTANSNMKTYVDGEISTTQGQITTANTALKSYTDTQLTLKASLSGATFTGNALFPTISLTSRGQVVFYDSDDTQYISLRAPSNVLANVTFSLPGADGTPGQVLTTDGAGNMSWTAASSGGGASGFQSSTITQAPAASSNYDLAKGTNQDAAVETPFESGGSDPFGVSLGIIYDAMEPVGSLVTVDYGDGEAYVDA